MNRCGVFCNFLNGCRYAVYLLLLAFYCYIISLLIEALLLFDYALYAFYFTGLFFVFALRRDSVKSFLFAICREISVIAGQMFVFDFKNPCAYAVKKISVVRNKHDRPAVLRKKIFKPCGRVGIQVVCRLVKHEQSAVFEQQFCQQDPCSVTAAECGHRKIMFLFGNAEPQQRRARPRTVCRTASVCKKFRQLRLSFYKRRVGRVRQFRIDFFEFFFRRNNVRKSVENFFKRGSVVRYGVRVLFHI